MTDSESYYIETDAELQHFCQQLGQHEGSPLAVDTEFLRERTYYPKPCLLQLSGETGIACVDLITVSDLGALRDLLFEVGRVKLMHACSQDLEIFHLLFGAVPVDIFDTQLAAAFCGYGDQLSYAALVDSLLQVHVPKAHTRARWCDRPLAQAEIHYAEDDVRYLQDIYQRLSTELDGLGRRAWFDADMQQLTGAMTIDNDPAEAWQRLGAVQQMAGRPLAAAKALAQWREQQARQRNKPRSWILSDALLLQIANRLPDSRSALAAIDGVNQGLLKHRGDDLLQIIAASEQHDEPGQPASSGRPTARQKTLRKYLATLLDETAEQLGVPASLLATRRDLMAMVQGQRQLPLLNGWRAEVVGHKLLEVIDQESAQ
jgi:ribonuclease D